MAGELDNGAMPAFSVPGIVTPNGDFLLPAYGLTKREHFAGLAMQGELASQSGDHQVVNELSIQWLSIRSVRIADAMLVALDGETRAAKTERALRLVVAEFERMGIPKGAESELLKQCREALE